MFELICSFKEFQQIPCPILTAAEGFILGVAAKLFTIASMMIVNGTAASVIFGVIDG